jgi:hypothetical protein
VKTHGWLTGSIRAPTRGSESVSWSFREANAEIQPFQPGGYFNRFDCPDDSDRLVGFFIVRWTVACFRCLQPLLFSLATVTWRSILPGYTKCSSPEPDGLNAHRFIDLMSAASKVSFSRTRSHAPLEWHTPSSAALVSRKMRIRPLPFSSINEESKAETDLLC